MSTIEASTLAMFVAGHRPRIIADWSGVTPWAIYKRIQRAKRKCVETLRRSPRPPRRQRNFLELSSFSI